MTAQNNKKNVIASANSESVIASEERAKQSHDTNPKPSHDAMANNKQITSKPSLRGTKQTTTKQSHALVPKLRFKEFEGEWEEITLGNLFTFKNGLNSDKEKYGTGRKFINVLDIIGSDVITYDSIIGKVEVTEKEIEKNEVIYGDILFQRSSETREEVGQTNVYVDRNQSAVFGGFVIRGRRKVEYDPYFMNYLLKTSPVRKEITTKSGGSTRYNVGQESLSQVFLKLTKLPEQQKIANFLTTVDTKIQQLNTKKELLEQYKKGVMQQLFSQKLRFKPDISQPSLQGSHCEEVRRGKLKQSATYENKTQFPDWEEKRLGEILTIGSGRDYKHLEEGDIPVYGTGGYMTSVNEYLFDGESVGIGRKGTIDKPVFLKGRFWTVDTLFYTHSFKNVLPFFIYLIFQTINWKLYNEASGVPSLSKSTLEKIKLNSPSLKEQQKIATYLSAIDTKIESVATQISKTETFKKGLLQQLFV